MSGSGKQENIAQRGWRAVFATGLCVAIGFLTAEAVAAAPETVPLTTLSPVTATQDYGALGSDRSVQGKALQIGGRRFARGLGTHANSTLVYDLAGEFTRFSALVGVDDEMAGYTNSSVRFQVVADGRRLFDSGVMRLGDAARPVDVDVAGVQELHLLVTDGGDGISCDHADWVEPVLIGQAGESGSPHHRLETPDLTLVFDEHGRILDGSSMGVSGQIRLGGCAVTGDVVARAEAGGHVFTRRMADARGHRATVTERFTPERDCVRWDVEIVSPDAGWSTPVTTRLRCGLPEEMLIWTAWGSPDFSGTHLTPELTALVQAGKASVGGAWSDPLVPVGFVDRRWHYGNVAQACPVGSDYVALPLFTVLVPASDRGLSLVLAPDDVLLDLDLTVTARGQFQFTRTRHRLGDNRPVRFTAYLVPHEASWRGGLRFLAGRYPQFFEAPNPRAHRIAGCGAYSICEAPIDAERFRKMAFGFNWKLSDDFPYMGMFIPPVTNAGQTWTRSGAEPNPPGKGPTTSCGQMNHYAAYMKQQGFSVLSYFNVTEFGKHVNPRRGPLAPGQADDPLLWQDCSAFLRAKMPDAWLRISEKDRTEWGAVGLTNGTKGLMSNCYGAAIVDPGDPDYLAFMVEQAARNIQWLPDTDGICIDRTDWLRFYNALADDGVSWGDGRPARSLYRSWASLMAKMGPLLHRADKVIFSNLMIMRLELGRELDGIYTEFGNNGNALNASALLGLRKPVVAWTYNETLRQPGPDAFMQRHLHLGVFPTAPYPYNNHCITPEPAADRLYLDYGPLLDALRGRKWVLAPRCIETTTPGAKVNLFEVPGGYAVPVTFGGTNATATVQLRHLPDLAALQGAALHPGATNTVALDATFSDETLTLRVPLQRGCAMVRLRK